MNQCVYCGREATHQFKNGKWCCSKNQSSCPENKRLTSKSMIGKNVGNKRPDILGDKNPMKNPEIAAKISGENHHMKKPEWRQWMKDNNPMKIKEYKDKISNENCHLWKGGTYWYLHKKAWELFGKDECERCGYSNIDHKNKYNRRLEMHNTLIPKNYKSLKQESWLCLCKTCHTIIEKTLE